MSIVKKRIDQLLMDKKLVSSRQKAKELIISKNVLVDGKFILKPNTIVNIESNIKIINELNYISRGELKLDKALKQFNINVNNLVCLDIGSSTGGFTNCLLNNNARLVYALDVGTNQLDWKVRNNKKVISMEKTNFRYSEKKDFDNEIEFAVCDVSFISLTKIIPRLIKVLKENASSVLLIKPQFETTKENVNKGKVTSKDIHIEVINKIIKFCYENNFEVLNLNYSPIVGNKKGNIEYLIYIKKNSDLTNKRFKNNDILIIVEEAWNMLLKK